MHIAGYPLGHPCGKEEVFKAAMKVSSNLKGLKLEFKDIKMKFSSERTIRVTKTADVHLTMKAYVPNEAGGIVRKMNIGFSDWYGRWLVHSVESVDPPPSGKM